MAADDEGISPSSKHALQPTMDKIVDNAGNVKVERTETEPADGKEGVIEDSNGQKKDSKKVKMAALNLDKIQKETDQPVDTINSAKSKESVRNKQTIEPPPMSTRRKQQQMLSPEQKLIIEKIEYLSTSSET